MKSHRRKTIRHPKRYKGNYESSIPKGLCLILECWGNMTAKLLALPNGSCGNGKLTRSIGERWKLMV